MMGLSVRQLNEGNCVRIFPPLKPRFSLFSTLTEMSVDVGRLRKLVVL